MSEAQIDLVKTQGFTINLPAISAPVAVRAESDEIVVIVRFTLRPSDNVVNIDLDVSASGDGAAVPCLDQNAAPQFGGYWRPNIIRHGDDS